MALPALGANYINYGNGTSTGHYAVTQWAAATAKVVGNLVRKLATPSINAERIFVCIVAGTTHATTEPTWTNTRGAKTTDNTVTWQECTGQPATNGDLTNTLTWTASKAQTASPSLGVIVKDASNNLFICTTAGTVGGSEPAWNTTVGVTTTDNTAVWTCIKNGAFANWAAPHARLLNSFTANWGAAGDDFYIGSNHAETGVSAGSINLQAPGTDALPNRIISVNAAGSVPPVAADILAGASISATATGTVYPGYGGTTYYYGVAFNSGSGSSNATMNISGAFASNLTLDTCSLNLNCTGASCTISINHTTQKVRLINTPMTFGNAAQSLSLAGNLEWENTPNAIQGTSPAVLLTALGNYSVKMRGLDLSGLGANALSDITLNGPQDILLENCKLHASTVLVTGSPSSKSDNLNLKNINCDSGNTNYKYTVVNPRVTITNEIIIVRTNGASDGTTPFSRKMVTTVNSYFGSPGRSEPIILWNESTSSVTVTVPIITDNVTLKNNEVWIEVEYLGTSDFPLSVFDYSSRVTTTLTTPTNQPTDNSSTWTTTGLSTPVKQKLTATFTPLMKGLIKVRVCLGKPSTTMYYDPTIGIPSAAQYMIAEGVINDPDDPDEDDVRDGTSYNQNRSIGSAILSFFCWMLLGIGK